MTKATREIRNIKTGETMTQTMRWNGVEYVFLAINDKWMVA